MGKILVSASHFDRLCKEAWALFEAEGHEVIYDARRPFPAYSFAELEGIIGDIDAALIGMDVYDEAVFAIAPKLKAVAKFGVGVDNIDGAAAKRHGVKVLNAPGQNSNAVAELALGLMLALLRELLPLHEGMKGGGWPRVIGSELKGKTVGLLGFGAIARLLARKLAAFDVELLAYDLYPERELAAALQVKLVGCDELIAASDIVSLHIPATAETRHFMNAARLAAMRPGAYLVNTARGALVDLETLSASLQSGHLAGAALDAFEVEPLPADAPIWQCRNIVLTPHTGAETKEAYANVSLCTARDICAVLAGKEPLHWTNR